ncbi:MAG: hypothetical protein Q8K63_15630 [Acidimicrobiales bacterium]|nr:hypothetical protein [Acidimicrobiales bacterium]
MKRCPPLARSAALVASLILGCLIADRADAQSQIVQNHYLNLLGHPTDLAITSDDSFAIVRTGSPVGGIGATVIVDLRPQPVGWPPYPIMGVPADWPHPTQINAFPRVCDMVESTDDCAAAIAFNMGNTVSASVKLFQPFVGAAAVLTSAVNGDAVDLEVGLAPSTMHPLAVVRHSLNYSGSPGAGDVSFWDLKAGQPWSVVSTMAAANSSTTCNSGVGLAEGLSDTIKLTANRVVALTNQGLPQVGVPPFAPQRGFVTIMELGASLAGWPKYYGFTPCGSALPNGYELVHDLAITPNQRRAVVSGTQVIGVYRLESGITLDVIQTASLPTPNFMIPYSLQTVDSVEVTDQRAVVIGNDRVHTGQPVPAFIPPSTDPDTFRVAVVDLKSPAPYPYVVLTAAMFGVTTKARVHDLAITPNQSKAIVTTRAGTLVLDLRKPISDALGTWATLVATTADPLNFNGGSQTFPESECFVSDSVACTDSQAVVIGRDQQLNPQAKVEVIDLLTPGFPIAWTIPLGTPGHFVPTDITITPDGSKALVRSVNLLSFTDGRITVIDLTNGQFRLDTSSITYPLQGSTGNSLGRDQIETTNLFAITAGQGGQLSNNTWIQVIQL